MTPLESARDFMKQLRQLGMYEQFSTLPAPYQRELYEWVQQATNQTDKLNRLNKLRSKLPS